MLRATCSSAAVAGTIREAATFGSSRNTEQVLSRIHHGNEFILRGKIFITVVERNAGHPRQFAASLPVFRSRPRWRAALDQPLQLWAGERSLSHSDRDGQQRQR